MQSFYNQNQILSVSLIPSDRIQWKINDTLYPLDQVFHVSKIQKKRVVIAYAVTEDGTTKYYSLADNSEVESYYALVNLSDLSISGQSLEVPIPLILESDDIAFKSSESKSQSGVLYTNKLEYTLPKVTDTGTGITDMEKLEEQLELLQSGKAFHLLIQLASCGDAYGIVLCPEESAFGASIEDSIKETKVTLTIKNLTGHQFLK